MRFAVCRFVPRLALIGLAATIVGPFPARCARAQDLVRGAVPNKWIDPYLPEDLPALELPAYVEKDPLAKARAESFAGRYKRSLMTIRAARGAAPADVALVRIASLGQIGKKDAALAAAAAPDVAADPRVEVERAKLLAQLGRAPEAVSLLKGHLSKNADSIAGHYWLGRVSEDLGDPETARAAYGWFEPFVDKWQGSGGRAFDSAQDVTLIARGLDRWASMTGAYQTRGAMHNIILGMFLKAYDTIDRGYWPAHVAAAEYYLSHDDQDKAMRELKAAAARNPRDVGTLKLMAQMMVSSANFDAADAAIAEVREIDPGAIEAEVLESRNWLQQRQPKAAMAAAQRVLARQPNHVEAKGLLAACYALQLNDDKAAALLKECDATAPQSPVAYFEVAEQLSAMRQYPRAEAMYKVALDRAPWWAAARNGLGMLYTQSGDEEAAYSVLDAAHAIDPFNYATTNYLRLLDDLRKFARKETDHFVILYDAQADPVVPEYFGEYLESVYASICAEYKFEPKVKTYIEVFPTADAFGVRIAGSPWIAATGASTGRVIALIAPRKGTKTQGPFNWALVLRHEFTHTVTLGATDNRIAHWMTEGLATVEEHSPLRWEWVPMLYRAVTHKELFTLEKLTFAFWRPKRPIDRQLAYAESFWVCKYIEDNWGHETILAMLKEFRAGKQQDDVFPRLLGESIPDFERDFFAWTAEQVATWGYDKDSTARYDELRKQADALVKARKYAEAAPVWEEIAKLRPLDQLAHRKLGVLYAPKYLNDPDRAIEHLLIVHRGEIRDNGIAKYVARMYRDTGKLDLAIKYATEAVYIDPYNVDGHELLGQLYEKSANADGVAKEARVVSVLHDWEERMAKKRELPKSSAQ